jgi:hypothetical protein
MSAVRGCLLFRCWWLSSPLNKSKRRTELCDNATSCTSWQEHEITHYFTNSISEIKYCFFLHLFMNHKACVLKIYGTKLIGDTDQRCIICRWKLKLYSAAVSVASLWTSRFLITETAEGPLLCLSVPIKSRTVLLHVSAVFLTLNKTQKYQLSLSDLPLHILLGIHPC